VNRKFAVLRIVICIALSLIILTGCSVAPVKTETPASKNPSVASTTVSTPAVKEPIKIGWFGALSGPSAISGQDTLDGVMLAVEEVNKRGGLLGRPIEVITVDDEYTPTVSYTVVQKLLYKDEVEVVFGSNSSPCVLAEMPLLIEAKTPNIVLGATSKAITNSGNPWVFRFCSTDVIMCSQLVDYIVNEAGLKKIAIMHTLNDYGQGGLAELKLNMTKNNIEAVTVQGFNENTKDFTPQLLEVKNSGAEALIIWSMYTDAAQILRQIKTLGLSLRLFGGTGTTVGNFRELAGDACIGFVGITTGYHPSKQVPMIQTFVKNYQAKYGKVPTVNSAQGYDGILILEDAVKRAGKIDKEIIMQALLATKDFEGTCGIVTSQPNGDAGTSATIFETLSVAGDVKILR